MINTTIYQEGYNAYKRGHGAHENPYWDERNFQQWRDGWNTAALEDSQVADEPDTPAFEPSNWPAVPGFAKNKVKRRAGNTIR